VARLHAGNRDAGPLSANDAMLLAGLETERVASQALRPGGGRQHQPRPRQKPATGVVEVVAVFVVAQRDGVDATDLLGGDRGTGELAHGHRRVFIRASRWVKGGVGEEADPAQFEQRRGAADQGQAQRGPRLANHPHSDYHSSGSRSSAGTREG
jgi:hypothetical protein